MTYSSRLKLSTDNFSPDTDLIEVFSKKAGVVGVINPRQIAPPSGTAGAIQFSDGSAFSSDVANLIWNNTTKSLGVGTNTPLATVHVKGSGSSSATTAFLVQNSAGNRILQSYDDRTTHVYNLVISVENTYGNSGFAMSSGGAGLGYITQSTYGGSYNTAINIGAGALSFTRNGEQLNGNSDFFVKIENTFRGASGAYLQNQNWSDLKLNYTIDNNVSSTGVATGLLLNATETSLNGMTHRLMDLQNGGVSRFTVLPNGNVGVNKNNPTYNFQVAGTSNVIYLGNNNRNRIFSVSNTDSTNTTFGLGVATFSDGSNRYLEIFGDSTTANNLQGNWIVIGTLLPNAGIISPYHSNLSIGQQFSNNIDTSILFYNSNNSYQTRIWRDGNVSIADSSYSTSASVTSRLFVKGSGSTSATTSLLVQNSSGLTSINATDDGTVTVGTNSYIALRRTDSILIRSFSGYEVHIGSGATNYLSVTTNGTHIATGSGAPVSSAQLQVDSTIRGFLKPRMTTTEKNAIATPAAGLEVFDTTLGRPCFYSGSAWVTL